LDVALNESGDKSPHSREAIITTVSMKKKKLIIWCDNDFTDADQLEIARLRETLSEHQLALFYESGPDSDSALRAADVAFGYPNPEVVLESSTLRWVQLNSAGYTSYDHADIKNQMVERGIALTNSSAVFDEPCAQHLLAMITGLARQLPWAHSVQQTDRSWPMLPIRSASRLLNGQTVLLLGYGAIARRVIELLTPLHMNLIAVRRTVTGTETIPVSDLSRVDDLLTTADHVVNILPANEETQHFLNARRLASLKRGAIVYNIGRGVTMDQDALIRELVDGRVAAAYLDVTDPEPLPPDHPLWRAPNCFITPHTGGGHANEKERQVELFLENFHRFENGEPMINRIL
jgi:phosphoglycerate dehydrogenase-like enzyme